MSPVRMKWPALAIVPIAAIVALTGVRLRSAAPVVGEWRAYNGNYASTRYSPLDQINKDTVKDLKVVWRQSLTPDAVKAGREGIPPPPANNQTTPLMIGGLVYYQHRHWGRRRCSTPQPARWCGTSIRPRPRPMCPLRRWLIPTAGGRSLAARPAASPTGRTGVTNASSR